MLGIALALAAATSAMDALDEANFTLTSCLFGVMRSHSAQRATPQRLAVALAKSCQAEEARLRTVMIAALVARGERRAAAATDIDALLARERVSMVEDYVRFQAFDASGFAK